ncbi:hypothetical protein LWI28_005894 [Acer negundo]|uniref:Uncharacterized protein n=1 Tax=Acer negundo TaxID=4023 RepID=A0AAD5J8H8_ACENE|nr:hypothetical protein LWI28_005894 [Acer negundo]
MATRSWEDRDCLSLLVEKDLITLDLFSKEAVENIVWGAAPHEHDLVEHTYIYDPNTTTCPDSQPQLGETVVPPRALKRRPAKGTPGSKVAKTATGTSASSAPHPDLPKDVAKERIPHVGASVFATASPLSFDWAQASEWVPRPTNQVSPLVVTTVQAPEKTLFDASTRQPNKSPLLFTLSSQIVLIDSNEEPYEDDSSERQSDHSSKVHKSSDQPYKIPLSVERVALSE